MVWLERGTRLSILNQECPPRFPSTDDQEDLTEMVMIGIDPHKGSHTAVALDDQELELASLRVRAGRRQRQQLLEWATPFDVRVWAIESANGLGYLLAQQLLAAGERVLDVPATLASRVRVLSSGRSNKNDPNDARSVAVAALRSPAMTEVRCEDHVTVLRLLAKRHIDLGRWRNKVCCRLHAHVAELVAGGISTEIVVAQASELLAGLHPRGVAAVERHRQALELVEDLARIDDQLRASRRRVTGAVAASGTTLTELFGVGPINAAILIGYTGDPRRFATQHHYAAYNGTAPIEIASAGRTIHRLSRRGNRQLNHAIHMAAVTQIRHTHSPGRAYFDRKVEEKKTPKVALRCLKRRISDSVYRRLVADARRARR
ncbi:MAG: IS110 family transposase [Chloroflexi bacterium]|nr:MAG: IS110 family transposase [Chloroflexota bacterium]TME88465.1 MAG: IS110 family transposase [Chloroflexota bacterium]